MRIVIVAGELSGDQLGEGVVRLLRAKYPEAVIEGIGGPKMISAGLKSLYPIETLSVMGIAEVLKHLPAILKLRKGLLRHLSCHSPDIYIGIDAPDFNLPVEKKLKKRGIKTVHYVSPSVWAWRERRIKKIKAATDLVLAILPFEAQFYQKHGHKAVFVGHPLANKIPLDPDVKGARKTLGITGEKPVIALLPGSRRQEIERLLPIFLAALERLKQSGYELEVVLPLAKSSLRPSLNRFSDALAALNIRVTEQKAHTVLAACDYVLVASGTATLEAMLYQKPMVVGYRLSKFTAWLVRRLLKIKTVALPNIIAGKMLVPELIQENFTAAKVADALKASLDHPARRAVLRQDFRKLSLLLRQDSDRKVVDEIVTLLGRTHF